MVCLHCQCQISVFYTGWILMHYAHLELLFIFHLLLLNMFYLFIVLVVDLFVSPIGTVVRFMISALLGIKVSYAIPRFH